MKKGRKEKVFWKLGQFYCRWIESLPYRNWFNPLITLYLNFRSFPFKQAIRFPVFVYGWPKLFALYGDMECVEKCKCGMIRLNQTNSGAPSNPGESTAINNWGKILFRGPCLIYTANKINVGRNGVLDVGANAKIMHCCNITAHKYVKVGNFTRITHRCQILDSNFHFVANFEKGTVGRYCKPIRIGDSCWICNSSTIAAGAVIPNKTIVASHSLVNKDMSNIPEESSIGGIPAKLLSSGLRRINNKKFEMQIWKFFAEHPNESVYPLDKSMNHDFCDE
ncbi:acyltransferase [uncultured Fibrobacter sp.]|uniref:acyltransferase n=1 Tax=uncultured Fibrobacter sp. TaxID=261512 RepID=UPI00262FA161|nr:acyltransferase [uncultured Fibrobacter sp.]